MEYGLIGEKLGHSFSAIIHGKIAPYPYRLKELSPEELPSFLQAKDFKAINVTIPYKQAVIPYLDTVSEEAAAIGAVNTVVNRDGRLYGYNTDLEGVKRLILRVTGGKPLRGKVLVLGTGGTSLTVMTAAKQLGADTVLRVSRTAKNGAMTYDEAVTCHADTSFLINTTPVGMFPNSEGMPISLAPFSHLTGVVDVVFNPLRTPLIREARRRGIPAEGGLYMLVAQAVAAYGHFFDTVPERTLTDSIYAELLSEKENVVLIGMPGSGKSSIGRALAALLDRPFYDTDEEVVKAEGMAIPAIFQNHGEAYFRDRESEAVSQVSRLGGAVIATGGGAVLREENVDALRSNGALFFLDRSLSLLMPTPDRPLAQSAEAIRARYEERYPIYRRAADAVIDGDGTVDEVAEMLLTIRKEKIKL